MAPVPLHRGVLLVLKYLGEEHLIKMQGNRPDNWKNASTECRRERAKGKLGETRKSSAVPELWMGEGRLMSRHEIASYWVLGEGKGKVGR